MKIEAHSLQVPRTAHYFTLGRPGPDIRYFWIACHGYGQLARRFIGKFSEIAAPDTLILAPEGLSRFYWNGLDGEVAASWMTREDRLDEIADYTNYLQTLYDHFLPRLAPDVRIILLGFSQGCATQLRWIMQRFPHFHCLVLWAGTVPEDLDYLSHREYFQTKKLYLVYGTEDPFLTPERRAEHQRLLTARQLTVEERTFAGPHTIDRRTLAALREEVVESLKPPSIPFSGDRGGR